jgi:hypothetical protein
MGFAAGGCPLMEVSRNTVTVVQSLGDALGIVLSANNSLLCDVVRANENTVNVISAVTAISLIGGITVGGDDACTFVPRLTLERNNVTSVGLIAAGIAVRPVIGGVMEVADNNVAVIGGSGALGISFEHCVNVAAAFATPSGQVLLSHMSGVTAVRRNTINITAGPVSSERIEFHSVGLRLWFPDAFGWPSTLPLASYVTNNAITSLGLGMVQCIGVGIFDPPAGSTHIVNNSTVVVDGYGATGFTVIANNTLAPIRQVHYSGLRANVTCRAARNCTAFRVVTPNATRMEMTDLVAFVEATALFSSIPMYGVARVYPCAVDAQGSLYASTLVFRYLTAAVRYIADGTVTVSSGASLTPLGMGVAPPMTAFAPFTWEINQVSVTLATNSTQPTRVGTLGNKRFAPYVFGAVSVHVSATHPAASLRFTNVSMWTDQTAAAGGYLTPPYIPSGLGATGGRVMAVNAGCVYAQGVLQSRADAAGIFAFAASSFTWDRCGAPSTRSQSASPAEDQPHTQTPIASIAIGATRSSTVSANASKMNPHTLTQVPLATRSRGRSRDDDDASGTASLRETRTRTVHVPQPPVAAATPTETANDVAVVVAGLSSITGSLPTAALQASMTLDIFEMINCVNRVPYDRPLSIPKSLLPGIALGTAESGGHFRAALVAAVCAMAVVCSVMAAVGFVLQWKQPAAGCGFEAQPEGSALLRALTAVQAPGTMLSVCAIVFSPSVANAVSTLQLSPSVGDVVLCIAAVGLPAALAVYVCLQVLKLLASGDVVYDPHTTIAPRFPSAFYAPGGWRHALAPPVLAFCFFGTGGWMAPDVAQRSKVSPRADEIPLNFADDAPPRSVRRGQLKIEGVHVQWAAPLDPEPTALMKRVRLTIQSYRGDVRATSVFYFLSMGAAVGSAIVRSVAVDCAIRQWVLFGWQLAYLALLLRLRPALVPIRRVLSCACSALTAAAFLLLGVHFTWEATPAAVLTAAEKLALAASVLSSVEAVLSVLRVLVIALHARLAPVGQTAAAYDAEAFGGDTAIEMGLAGLTFALSRALVAPRPTDEVVVLSPSSSVVPPRAPPLPPPRRWAPQSTLGEDFTSGDDDADVLRDIDAAAIRERMTRLLV